jgi:valyl-tRNA synthetase
VSVFGWLRHERDFDVFYPTQLLVTGFDILFFWVARMIMLGCWFSKDVPMPDGSKREAKDTVPFREVYIHALVRDAERQKMSKTKGNVIDPIEIVERYGTDAVRFTLASMASPGTDIAFSEARTEGYRAFANKIWNAARFIFMNVERAREAGIAVERSALGGTPTASAGDPLEARWIVAELNATAARVNQALEGYRFDDAANAIYQFFWGSFCDWYLEIVKLRLDFSEGANKAATKAALTTLLQTFEAALRLLSPFMPFLTEELWHAVYEGEAPAKSIALTRYPMGAMNTDDNSVHGMKRIQALIMAIRARRKEICVPEKEQVGIFIVYDAGSNRGSTRKEINNVYRENEEIIHRMARVSAIERKDLDFLSANRNLGWDQGGGPWFAVLYDKPLDTSAERERLTKELAKQEKALTAAEKQLNNPAFLAKAPETVVEGLKKQEADTRLLMDKTRRALEELG